MKGRGAGGGTYMDSSSLLAHRLTVEPSVSRMTMRFSRGLFSGGVTPAQSTRTQSITGEKHRFKLNSDSECIVQVTSLHFKVKNVLTGHPSRRKQCCATLPPHSRPEVTSTHDVFRLTRCSSSRRLSVL